MNPTNKLPEIRKDAFSKARGDLGLTTQELAVKACLSARQIEQIENGESGSFYGIQNKFTAAKKVAAILKLNEEEAFDFAGIAPIVAPVVLVPSTAKAEKVSKPEIEPAAKAESKPQPQQELKLDAVEKKSSPQQRKPIAQPASDLAIELGDPLGNSLASKEKKSSGSQRKWMLLLSIAAALVFSVINLRPLFFPEKPQEEVTQEVPAEPASLPSEDKSASSPPPVVAAAAITPIATGECPATDSMPLSYKPDAPKKAGDMVYLQAKTAQVVCVIDAQGKVQTKQLEPGVGMSVYGKPPLKVLTNGLDQVELFYQGAKVRPSNASGKTIVLESAEFTQPLTPSDSQLR